MSRLSDQARLAAWMLTTLAILTLGVAADLHHWII